MPAFFIYLLKANIALTICYLAYRFGLRRLTFYTLNRFFLLFGIFFSALFPLANVNALFRWSGSFANGVAPYTPDWNSLQQYLASRDTFTVWDLLQYVFWAGVALMAVRFLIQLISLRRIHLRSVAGTVNGESVRVMREQINPFSFFRNIYLNPSLHVPAELDAIIIHEKIHVKGWHSGDVMTGEINNIFYWFNPGAWLMKSAIRENLEFIVDRKILQSGMDVKTYQYSLIKVCGIPYAAAIANNFNFSHLKQRIMMMNKKRSTRINFLRYVLLVPVVTVIALLIFTGSRGQNSHTGNKVISFLKADTIQSMSSLPLTLPATVPDSVPPSRAATLPAVKFTPPVVVRDTVAPASGADNSYARLAYRAAREKYFAEADHYAKEPLKINPDNAYAKALEVYMGQLKVYNERGKEYKRSSGRFLTLDSVPPSSSSRLFQKEYKEEYRYFLEKNPAVRSLSWGGSPNERATVARVLLKNGYLEKYDLKDAAEMEKVTAKYGKLPSAPVLADPRSLPTVQFTPPKITRDSVPPPPPSPVPPPPPPPKPKVHFTPPAVVKDRALSSSGDHYATLAFQAAKKEQNFDKAAYYAGEALKINPGNTLVTQVNAYIQRIKEENKKGTMWDLDPLHQPLLILDGKELPLASLKKMDPDNIGSITVLKDAAAVQKYGDLKAMNGVLIVTTKDAESMGRKDTTNVILRLTPMPSDNKRK